MMVLSADIAGHGDFTAATGLRVSDVWPRSHFVGYLDKWHAKYTETVTKLAKLATAPAFRDAVLVVDATGVGSPVVDQLREALPGRVVWGVTITGGTVVTRGRTPRDVRVPKVTLVRTVQVLVQTKRLKWSRQLPLFRDLEDELGRFQEQRTAALNTTYEAATGHDDLVMSLALGCWLAEAVPAPMDDERVAGLVWNERPGAEPEAEPPSGVEALAADFPHLFGDD